MSEKQTIEDLRTVFLKELNRRNMSRLELARRAGVGRGTTERLASGKNITTGPLFKIMAALNMKIVIDDSKD